MILVIVTVGQWAEEAVDAQLGISALAGLNFSGMGYGLGLNGEPR